MAAKARSYEVHCGDVRRVAGASAVLPRGVPHGFRNAGSVPARLISVITPSGLEDYFISISKFESQPSPADLAKLAGSYGLTLLPPLLLLCAGQCRPKANSGP
jgi:hypothetical protein